MDTLSAALFLKCALWVYAAGILGGLVFSRTDRLANGISFGCATLGGALGITSAILVLLPGSTSSPVTFELWTSLVPYVKLSVKLDPLGAFFLLTLSVLAVALSIYSFGYARAFYGRKPVGLLGAFFNALLLATTLVFTASNAFFFLIAWEIMALTAYCLVSFEHEKPETRKAGVLYFVMSHVGTGCLILAFLLLFQTTHDYSFGSQPG